MDYSGIVEKATNSFFFPFEYLLRISALAVEVSDGRLFVEIAVADYSVKTEEVEFQIEPPLNEIAVIERTRQELKKFFGNAKQNLY